MTRLLVCAHGHQWEFGDEPGQPPSACPVCGGPGTMATHYPTEADSLTGTKPMPASAIAPSPAATRVLNPTFEPSPSVRPVSIAGYTLLNELGRGGMGVVYKARQAMLNRYVALKMILNGEKAGPQERIRFLAEAEAVAHLQHPNIVQIYEVGEHDDCPFLSLEFVDGGNLANRVTREPLSFHQAAALVETLARAVQAAHERGIIHRDLKPANVLLTADGTPKITDFGLARRLDAGVDHNRPGTVVGTPSYMAPEQAGGRSDVGPLVDVYALGAILYTLLTGRPPFRAETSKETLRQVLLQEPTPPSQIQPQIPADLETICLKCLEKEPERRFPSAAAVGEELGRFLRAEPIHTRPLSLLVRGWRWCHRKPRMAAGLAGVLLLLSGIALLAVCLAIASWTVAERQRQQLSGLALAHGTMLCESGNVGPGLLWLARALDLSRDDASREEIRARLTQWAGQAAPVSREPRRLLLWVQTLHGLELDEHGQARKLSAEEIQQRRAALDQLGGTP